MPVFSNNGGSGGGGGGGSSVATFDCANSISVGNAVYLSAVNTVAKAFMGVAGQTPEAIGIVIAKPTAITCTVLLSGATGPILAGLTTGAIYYVSRATAGLITATAPTGQGEKVQRIGVAAATDNLVVNPDLTSTLLQ